jgi:hypothetical protein
MTQSKTDNPKGGKDRKVNNAPASVTRSFVACPRCSFFLAGYRLIHDDFAEAVSNRQGNWLNLTWNSASRSLVQKSFGWWIGMDATHYEGICQDCRRIFIYSGPTVRKDLETFDVQIKPG